ncbi:MAG: hypothetical protein IJ856_01185 [Candidatus Methanomethylophilaceae archaeon]|nr:hypothetical protein [Candidatus Methanomethylophilaceae archaeon]
MQSTAGPDVRRQSDSLMEQIGEALDWSTVPLAQGPLVFVGIGSSAIAAELVAGYVAETTDVFVPVLSGKDVPGWIGAGTQAVLISYSGDTEEVLSAYGVLMERGSSVVAVTSGGALARSAEENGTPLVRLPGGSTSRGSLGYMVGALASMVQASGVCAVADRLRDIVGSMEVPGSPSSSGLEAERIACAVSGKVPVIYGQPDVHPACMRWRFQTVEEVSGLCFDGAIPEYNHNEIIAWTQDYCNKGRFVPVFLYDEGWSDTVRAFTEASIELIERHGVGCVVTRFEGSDVLEKNLKLIRIGDMVAARMKHKRSGS